jgi:histidinol-phosphate aminotransferase
MNDEFLLTRRALGRSVAMTTVGAYLWPNAVASAMGANAATIAKPDAISMKGMIRIGANENPYGMGPAAAEAVRQAVAVGNRYPNEVIGQLMAALAKFHDVPAEQIALAPGSGDVLRASTLAFTSASLPLVGAAPTFEAPARIAEMNGVPVKAPKVTATGQLDLPAMAAVGAGAGMFYVCNPNNPTGSIVSGAAVADFVARVRKVNTDGVILVDEAYADLIEDPSFSSAAALIKTDKKVLVSRTFSKIHGMAGLRVGYAIGHPDTLAALRKSMSMGNIAVTSLAAAIASMADTENMKKQKAMNSEQRALARKAFETAGYTVLPSEANFIMVDIKRDVRGFQTACKDAGILIARPFPPLNTYARITIGTAEEMAKATPAMLSLLASAPTSARLREERQPVAETIDAALFNEIPGFPAC